MIEETDYFEEMSIDDGGLLSHDCLGCSCTCACSCSCPSGSCLDDDKAKDPIDDDKADHPYDHSRDYHAD